MTPDEALLVEAARRGLLPDPPAPDMSAGARAQRFGLGMVRGLRDPIDAGAQLLTRGLETVLPGAAGEFMKGERERVEAINRNAERDYQRNWRDGVTGFDAGRVASNIAAAVALTRGMPTTLAGGAASGAVSGAMAPVEIPAEPTGEDPSFWLEKAKQTAVGATLGAAGTLARKALTRVIQPQTSPEVKALMEAGVRPTPGQMMGGIARTTEEKLGSVPVLGEFVNSAQRRAMEGFDRAAIDKALAPIGEKIGRGAISRETIAEASQKVSQAYDDLLPNLTLRADQQFATDLTSLAQLAQNLPKDRAAQFNKIMADQVLSKFNSQTGTMSGETLKAVESELGRLGRAYGKSMVGDERLLGNAVRELGSTLRGLLERSNPAQAETLKNINQAYAMLLRVENAATRGGARMEPGTFSPAALTAATKALDSSLRHRAFARGDALMQDFAEAGNKVLGSRVPDSGTAGRVLNAAFLGGAPAAAALVNPYAAGAAGAASLAYTPWGQSALAHALATRPQSAGPLAQQIARLGPVAATALPTLFPPAVLDPYADILP